MKEAIGKAEIDANVFVVDYLRTSGASCCIVEVGASRVQPVELDATAARLQRPGTGSVRLTPSS